MSYQKEANGSLKVLEENNYYPFGLKHSGYNNTNLANTNYKYKYQGQELQDEHGLGWYSFKYRNYDPAIGRFFNVDPLSEKYAYQSHYNFQENKMGSGVELEGLELQLAPYLLEALAASGAGGVVLGTAHTQNSGAQVPEILTISLSETIIIGTASTVYSINNEFNQNSGKSIFGKIISGIASGLNAAWNILNNDSKNEADNKSTETTSGAETEATNEQSKAEQRAAKLSLKPRDGMDFTKAGKEAVIDVNKEKNGGKTVCVGCKTETVPAKKSEKGVTPPKNETQVDHIIRKREGGSGTPDNGQVLCRGCNLKKH